MPSQNREQRRAAKFGRHRTIDQGPWPETAPNPALGGAGVPPTPPGDEAAAGQPDEGAAGTGPGTGGATEGAGRVRRHSGTHATNSAKG
jgi:hypothetical protein